jgi:hypothetical protein
MSRGESGMSHLSGFTTEPEEDAVALVATANAKIDNYVTGRSDDENLSRCLQAFLAFLPGDGCVSVARDIIACGDDDGLYKVLGNLQRLSFTPVSLFTMYLVSTLQNNED